MKKRIFGIIVIISGALLIVVSLLVPLIVMSGATAQAPIAIIGGAEKGAASIGIIGGADGPTYIYMHQTAWNGALPAIMALGVLALVSGVVVWIVDTVERKRS